MSYSWRSIPLPNASSHREIAGSLTIKVRGSIQRRVPSVESGVNLFEKALEGRKVEILCSN